jgi:hypothetical protein
VTITNRGIVLWTALLIFLGSFGPPPLIGKGARRRSTSFISLRLNTPVGTSLDSLTRRINARRFSQR